MAEDAPLGARDRLPPRARADAGFHRGAGGGRSRGDAPGDGKAWRRSAAHQPALAGRPRHRPLRHGRRLRLAQGLHREREARIRAQRRALRLPQMGAGRLRQFPRRAAGHRHLPPSQSRIPGPGGMDHGGGRQDRGLSRHARRHRQPHHHGQRSCRARLGRRRHRGGGGDAGTADLHGAAGGYGVQALRQAQGRCDSDRSRAHGDADAAQEGRGRPLRRILRVGRGEPRARRPRHHRQHGARIWRHLRLLPDRSDDDQLSHLHRPRPAAGEAGRGLCQGAGLVARRKGAGSRFHRHARTRSRQRRAVARRATPTAGPRGAVGGRQILRRGAAQARGHDGSIEAQSRRACHRHELRRQGRRRRHRRHHQLHQHLETTLRPTCRRISMPWDSV